MASRAFAEHSELDPARLIAAHEAAAVFYRDQLLRADGPQRYLANRGLGILARPDLPWRRGIDLPWRLGYAPPGPTAVTRHLTTNGFTAEELRAAGLAHDRGGRLIDTFRDRIMMPIRDRASDIVAFIGRAVSADPNAPKYLNSRDSIIYHKGQTLYGLAEQGDHLDAGWAPVIVEGPLDVLAVWLAHPADAGVGRAAVAPCGTALTSHQTAAIVELPGANLHGVTVAFDADPAGQAATDRAWQLLNEHSDLVLRGASLPGGVDPADLIREPDTAAVLRAALTYQSRPLIDVVVDHRLDQLLARHPRLLEHPGGQIAAVRTLAPLVADLNGQEAAAVAAHLAARTGVRISTVTWCVIAALEQSPRNRSGGAAEPGWAKGFPPLTTLETTAGADPTPTPTMPDAHAPTAARR